ncbi:hypothetical protein LGQ03_13405 [Loktanella sp. TSTF-M6]|uniref:Phage integrase family protein n=1 Tax=Loktanella gaetbuli TaxID=2881335 RepID=A0ABS8BWW9_9RHOB|nr:hypothetical protein [Loktanella gaetbuli]MCB5200242.1 hypothetical protein [Loktanella gaetbuli]
MHQPRYLFRQGRHFHFRRRIPGLSTSIRSVQVALGTTDEKTAHTWSRTLTTEFDAMLNAFTFLIDPLPEALIATYIQTRMQVIIDDLRRELRMERMSGRRTSPHATHRVQRAVLRALVEDGIAPALEPARIDPSWTADEVQGAVTLYANDVRGLRDQDQRQRVIRDFETVTGVKVASREHEYQIIEAHLQARLAALDAEQNCRDLRAQVYADLAKTLISQAETPPLVPVREVMSETVTQSLAAPAPSLVAVLPQQVPTKAIEAARAIQITADKRKISFTPGVDEIREPLTIDALRAQQAQAEAVARHHEKVIDGPDIAGIFWRMATTDGLSKETIAQRAASLRLFCLITSLQRVDDIRQHHLSAFRDALATFPIHFMRSPQDGSRTIEDIMQKARFMPDSEKGPHVSTRQRHIKSVELLLERAASEGHDLDPALNTKKIKPKAKGKSAKHKQRPVFTAEELKTVFAHHLWQGAQSEGSRHEPGSVIVRDSRYWIPLILAYTGARRAEIAGLKISDLKHIDGHPCIVIQANEYRSIKGEEPGETDARFQKTRIVPLHPHLIELGLCRHVSEMADRGEKLMFPDVVPVPRKKSRRAAATDPALMVDKFGASIDYMWRTSLEAALDGNPRNLCMHSMRHYVNDFFLFSSDVLGAVRFDLVGHVKSENEDTNTSVYRGEAPIHLKLAAINKLPRLF